MTQLHQRRGRRCNQWSATVNNGRATILTDLEVQVRLKITNMTRLENPTIWRCIYFLFEDGDVPKSHVSFLGGVDFCYFNLLQRHFHLTVQRFPPRCPDRTRGFGLRGPLEPNRPARFVGFFLVKSQEGQVDFGWKKRLKSHKNLVLVGETSLLRNKALPNSQVGKCLLARYQPTPMWKPWGRGDVQPQYW